MWICTIMVILAILCPSGLIYATGWMPVPAMAAAERGEYQARNARTGGELWRTSWVLDRTTAEGHTLIRVQEDGRGRRDSDVPTVWTVHMTLNLSSQALRVSLAREVRDTVGHLLEVQEREMDYPDGSGQVITTDGRTGQSESRSFPLTARSIGVEMLATEFRLLPDLPDQQMQFDLITRDGKVLGMQAKVVGRERVTVPAGSFECYKVEMAPTGLLGVLADLLMPKMYMWHTVAAPHIWIKFQGAEGGPGSPEIVRELVRFTPVPD